MDKGAVFLECILEPEVLEHVGHVLGPRFKLSSLNARSANPWSDEAQPLHVDGGALPDAQRLDEVGSDGEAFMQTPAR